MRFVRAEMEALIDDPKGERLPSCPALSYRLVLPCPPSLPALPRTPPAPPTPWRSPPHPHPSLPATIRPEVRMLRQRIFKLDHKTKRGALGERAYVGANVAVLGSVCGGG